MHKKSVRKKTPLCFCLRRKTSYENSFYTFGLNAFCVSGKNSSAWCFLFICTWSHRAAAVAEADASRKKTRKTKIKIRRDINVCVRVCVWVGGVPLWVGGVMCMRFLTIFRICVFICCIRLISHTLRISFYQKPLRHPSQSSHSALFPSPSTIHIYIIYSRAKWLAVTSIVLLLYVLHTHIWIHTRIHINV